MNPSPSFNIPITDFLKNYECINCSKDIWQNQKGDKVVVIFESEDYFVVKNKG